MRPNPPPAEWTIAQGLSTSRAALQELGYSLSSPEVRAAMKNHELSLQAHYLLEFQQLVAELKATKGAASLFRRHMDPSTRRIGAEELHRLLPVLQLEHESEHSLLAHYSEGRRTMTEEQFCNLFADASRFAKQHVAGSATTMPAAPPPPAARMDEVDEVLRQLQPPVEPPPLQPTHEPPRMQVDGTWVSTADEIVALRDKCTALQEQIDSLGNRSATAAPRATISSGEMISTVEIDGPPVVVAASAASSATSPPKAGTPSAHTVFAVRDLEKRLASSEAEVAKLKARVLQLTTS